MKKDKSLIDFLPNMEDTKQFCLKTFILKILITSTLDTHCTQDSTTVSSITLKLSGFFKTRKNGRYQFQVPPGLKTRCRYFTSTLTPQPMMWLRRM